MKKVFLLLFCLCSTLSFGLDRNAARQLERLMNNAVGVISTFPEEIRNRRSGGMEQQVEISDQGVLTLNFSFRCYPLPEEGKKVRMQLATSRKSFALGEFKGSSTKRYEFNPHLNTIAFYDHGVAWVIAFRSKVDLEHASKLLLQLIKSAQAVPQTKIDAAKIAKDAGFRYVVFAPRASSLDDEIRLLRGPEQSSNMVCWLTKSEPAVTTELLAESYNAFPLFFYDLNLLDESPFYTVSTPGMSAFFPCTLGKEYLQSVFSDDETGLEKFFHDASYVGIRFHNMPLCKSPASILCVETDKKMKQKAHGMALEETSIIQATPAYRDPEIIDVSSEVWLTGLNDNSDDILRYLLWNKKITNENLSKTVYREFPDLSTLLKTKSHYRKDLSLEDCLVMRMGCFYSIMGGLSPFSKKVLMVASFTNDLGSPFGTDEELCYNSWPLALALAEKVGLNENEKQAVRLKIQDQPLPGAKENEKGGLTFFVQEAREAAELGLNVGEWMSLKMCFDLVLSKQFNTVPAYLSAPMKRLKDASEKYEILLPFSIPFGISIFKGAFPTESMVSTYIWEALDPKHRDGLSLKRCRERYEKLMIEKPKSPWKGRFWVWVDRECDKGKMPSQVYLKTEQERAKYRAVFENGLLVSPAYPAEEELDLLFVVDTWGRLFIAPQEPGFSHASFLAGEPVAAAGKILFKNQKIVSVTDSSHRYPSGPNDIEIALEVLKKAGISLDEIHE